MRNRRTPYVRTYYRFARRNIMHAFSYNVSIPGQLVRRQLSDPESDRCRVLIISRYVAPRSTPQRNTMCFCLGWLQIRISARNKFSDSNDAHHILVFAASVIPSLSDDTYSSSSMRDIMKNDYSLLYCRHTRTKHISGTYKKTFEPRAPMNKI